MKAIVQLKATRQPVSGSIIGYRMQAAIPNMNGRAMRAIFDGEGEVVAYTTTGQAAPSFRKPFFIAESSDYSEVSLKEISRFLDRLRWEGYREYEFVGKTWERQGFEATDLAAAAQPHSGRT